MTSKHSEYVVCVDSFTGKKPINKSDTVHDMNHTNDIIVSAQTTVNRLRIKAMELVTFELPPIQFLIEIDWSRLYFGNAWSFPIGSTTFSVIDQSLNDQYEAILPPNFNTIISVDLTIPTSPIFTTDDPHLLSEYLSIWPHIIRLVGMTVPIILDGTNTTVLNSTNFQVSGVVGLTVDPAAVQFGSLYYSPLEDANNISMFIQRGLNESYNLQFGNNANPFLMIYDEKTGEFCLSVCTNLCLPETQLKNLFLNVPVQSLPFLLGYGTGLIKLSEIQTPQCATNGCTIPELVPKILKSNPNEQFNVCFTLLRPGKYVLPSDFLAELDFQASRFYFDPTTGPYSVSISNTAGVVTTVNILSGLYTAETLAQTLTNLLTAQGITVTFLTNSYEFSSADIFNLEFQLPDEIANRLGFAPIRYSGAKSYTSPIPFAPPCGPGGCLLDWSLVGDSCQLLLQASSLPAISATVIQSGSDGLVTTTTAHGFQVGNLINLVVLGVTFEVEVVEVSSGTNLTVDLGGIVLGAGVAVVSLAEPCNLNILMAPRYNSMKPEILGFPNEDIWGAGSSYLAPYRVNTSGLPYILMQIIDPPISARVEHVNRHGQTLSNLIAKIPLQRVGFQLFNRYFPTTATFFSHTIVNEIHVRFLTPDHELVQLRGLPWSATFRFYL